MKLHTRKIFVLGRLLLVLAPLLQVSGVAFAQVWTDPLDHAGVARSPFRAAMT